MIHVHQDIVDIMTINLFFNLSKQDNIDDAMSIFHTPYIYIKSGKKLDTISKAILFTAEKLYTKGE